MIDHRFRELVVASTVTVVMAVMSMSMVGPAMAGGGPGVTQGNANPGVIPNKGHQYADLAAQWWLWAFSFPVADAPFFNAGGAVDASDGQQGHIWFLSG